LDLDICIPYIGVGINYLEKQIENFIQLSSGKNKLNFKVSYHTQEDLEILQKSIIHKYVSETVQAEKCDKNIFYASSVSHTNAINKLYSKCSSEVCIFTDYDIYFLFKNWDDEIIDMLDNNRYDLFGTPYRSEFVNIKNFTGQDLPARHYQKCPNLSFLCFKLQKMKNYFPLKLTDFDEMSDLPNFTPFVIINTEELQNTYQMDLGEVLWLDTGYEIPKIIFKHHIAYKSMEYSLTDLIHGGLSQNVFSPEYMLHNKKKFLVHYKKGTLKAFKKDQSFDQFYHDIQTLIA
jgi:hypothetical protein